MPAGFTDQTQLLLSIANGVFKDIDCSSDGQIVITGDYNTGGFIYTSNSGGNDWVPRNFMPQRWQSVAISSNGQHMAAAIYGYGIWTSLNQGESWTLQSNVGNRNWSSLSMLDMGTLFHASVNNGNIYTIHSVNSTFDSYITRTAAGSRAWNKIATRNGIVLGFLSTSTNTIYRSADWGATWGTLSVGTSKVNTDAAFSQDSTIVYLSRTGSTGDRIFKSTNSGGSFAQLPNCPISNWIGVSCTNDGSLVVAVNETGTIGLSDDAGETWNLVETGIPFTAVKVSLNGEKIYMTASNPGRVYELIKEEEPQPPAALSYQKFFIKVVNDVPETFEATTLYMVKSTQSDIFDLYMTDKDGVEIYHTPTATEITSMINEAVDAATNLLVVYDIAARDALQLNVMSQVMVLDASGDPTVQSGAAVYLYDPSNPNTWIKTFEYESLDVTYSWGDIQGRPVSIVPDIDGMVALVHIHINSDVLNDLSDTDNLLTYDGEFVGSYVVNREW